MASPTVVVGVQGRPEEIPALEWAAHEANLRGAAVVAVHASALPIGTAAGAGPMVLPSRELLASVHLEASSLLLRAADSIHRAAPAVEVAIRFIEKSPVVAMMSSCRGADLVVLGPPRPSLQHLFAASVSRRLLARSTVPVVVVRAAARSAGAVVVEVDGTAASRLAMDFAAQEAVLRGAGLLAVHVWRRRLVRRVLDWPLLDSWDAELEALLLVEREVDALRAHHPRLPITVRLVSGDPVKLLATEAATAQLVVVGAGGRKTLASRSIGATVHALLRRTSCPLAVVPAPSPSTA